jgi:starch synthase
MGLKILVCSSEVVPFAKTGGLADVAGALPRVLVGLGHEVRVAMPNYSAIDQEKAKPETVGTVAVQMGGESVSATIAVSGLIPEVPTYLVDCPRYYQRGTLYGEPDDAERFAFFCRALLEFLRTSDWRPDVIHCNDWQTALIPVYLKTTYAEDPDLAPIATLFTVHNLAYQGVFETSVLDRIGLDRSLLSMDRLEFYGQANFMKGGLVLADVLNTVSKTYAREIQTPDYGERLEGVLAQRAEDLFGVVNGLDYDEWNPATDTFLAASFTAKHPEAKAACKADLQKRSNLPVRPSVPLFGLVSRLAGQKGLDLLADVLPHLLKMDVQFVLLGSGEALYQDLMTDLSRQYPEKMSAVIGFDNALAHQIYGGADFFLMPSHYEPCGLGQLISVRYGTVPIVRHTGGLADTITDYNAETEEGNGFSFVDRSAVALLGAISRGILTMGTQPAWQRLVRNAMACDFSWPRSAEAYVSLYTRARARHGSV